MTTPAGYEIRLARGADILSLPAVELEATTLFSAYREELGVKSLTLDQVNCLEPFRAAQEAGRLWVAVDSQHQPVAFALVVTIDGLAHLDELDVLPAHGRKGLGSALLETVCEWARSSGYPGVTLSTFRDVPWNAPFYARRGFRVFRTEELSPGFIRLVEAEQERGVRTDLRVIMRLDT